MEKDDAKKILVELHDGPIGGHFGGETTEHIILKDGYYYPNLLKYYNSYTRKLKVFQISIRREKKLAIPLKLVTIDGPFEQLGLDVIREITPYLSKQNKYITITNYYFTQWIEYIPIRQVN